MTRHREFFELVGEAACRHRWIIGVYVVMRATCSLISFRWARRNLMANQEAERLGNLRKSLDENRLCKDPASGAHGQTRFETSFDRDSPLVAFGVLRGAENSLDSYSLR